MSLLTFVRSGTVTGHSAGEETSVDANFSCFVVAGTFGSRELLRSLFEGSGLPVLVFESIDHFLGTCSPRPCGWLAMLSGAEGDAPGQVRIGRLDGKGNLLLPGRGVSGLKPKE